MAAVELEATIQVRGNAVRRAEPDEALLSITLTTLADSPGPALADVSTRTGALSDLLDELGIDTTDRTTTGITVFEEFDHTSRGGRQSLGHRALTQVSVRLTDRLRLGRLVSRAVEELAARVEGPRWQIAPDNPVRLEAARAAARDAESKARAYAEGVGLRLGRPLRLNESDSVRGAIRSEGWVAAAAAPVPVDPGEHEVFASIQVTFALETEAPPETA